MIPVRNGRVFSGVSKPGSWEEAAALWQTSLHPCATILTSGDALFQRDLGFSSGFGCVFCAKTDSQRTKVMIIIMIWKLHCWTFFSLYVSLHPH